MVLHLGIFLSNHMFTAVFTSLLSPTESIVGNNLNAYQWGIDYTNYI